MSDSDSQICKYCGKSISSKNSEFYIEPDYGFKTGPTKESTRMKPEKSFAGEVIYLGGGKPDPEGLDIKGIIQISSTTEDKLLVMNKKTFYMCHKCGYSEIAGKNVCSTFNKQHDNFRGYKCENEELTRLRIGHSFQTDVVRLTIPQLSASEKDGYSIALSFMYALLEGMSMALEVERHDINGVLEMNRAKSSFDLLLYDDVPGGAGQVKRIINEDALILSMKEALVKVSQNCCDENTSCYNCLRNYYNQAYHRRLKRIYARKTLERILREIK